MYVSAFCCVSSARGVVGLQLLVYLKLRTETEDKNMFLCFTDLHTVWICETAEDWNPSCETVGSVAFSGHLLRTGRYFYTWRCLWLCNFLAWLCDVVPSSPSLCAVGPVCRPASHCGQMCCILSSGQGQPLILYRKTFNVMCFTDHTCSLYYS